MALQCELCDSTDLLKDDGVYACQGCGAKYTVEEAKRMIAGGSPAPAESPRNAKALENYLALARSARDATNNEEAEEYANKVLELDATCSEAWLIKANAVGWQSSIANDRLDESFVAWKAAYDHADEDRKAEVSEEIDEAALGLLRASVLTRCNTFGQYPSADTGSKLTTYPQQAAQLAAALIVTTSSDIDLDDLMQFIGREMNDAAVEGWKVATRDFGPAPSDMYKAAWDRFIERGNACISVLEGAGMIAKAEETKRSIYSNLVIIQTNLIDSSSYTNNGYGYVKEWSLNDQAKQGRRARIAEWVKERDANDPKMRAQREAEQKRREAEAEKKRRHDAYWAEHADERKELEAEAAELAAKIKGLGLFKRNEKPVLQARIDEINEELSRER